MSYSPIGEDLFSEKVISQLEQEGLTVNWRYGYRLANRYEVRRVHAGGFGIVWIVEDEMEGSKRYAAKAPKAYFRRFTDPKEGERRQRLADMFLNECKIWVDLGKHRHIVQAEFLEKIEGVPIVMSEYIDGGDLEHILKEGSLDMPTVLDYAIQFCLGMEYASQQGVAVHRDIKPGNIMVTKGNVVKINDFGLAKAIEAVEPIVVRERLEALSEAGLVTVSRGGGTPPYMAPEQFPEEILKPCGYPAPPITTRSDIFSFGLVLYEMVTDRPACYVDFSAEKAHEIKTKADDVYAGIQWEIKPYKDAHAELPPQLSKLEGWSSQDISYLLIWHSLTPELLSCNKHLHDIIIKCLKIDPDERYENFIELKEELFKLYREGTGKEYEVKEEPAYKPSNRNMAKTYWILGREEEAFEFYDMALEENPGDTAAWLEKGLASAEVGDLPEFGLCLETIPYLRPSKQLAVDRYKEQTLNELQVVPRDIRLLDRLFFEHPICSKARDLLLDRVEHQSADAFRELNPELAKLFDGLGSQDKWLARRCAQSLGELGDALAVPPLAQALRDEDRGVRKGAAQALGKLGDRSAVKPLIEALKDDDYEVCREAARALGRLGDRSAVKPLLKAVKDEDYGLRTAAAQALGDLGDRSAIGPLIEALEGEVPGVSKEAARALGKLGDRLAVKPLIKALKDKHPDVRRGATEALGELGDMLAVPPLIQALRLRDPNMRQEAARALGKLGDRSAVKPLIESLKDDAYEVCREAARALGRLGDRSAVPSLIRALGGQDRDRRRKAARALGELGDTSAVRALVQVTKDGDYLLRSEAMQALGELADTSSVPTLIEALKNENYDVRLEIVKILGKLGDRLAVPVLIEALGEDEDTDVRQTAAQALGELDDTSAVPLLTQALRGDDHGVRRQAAQALGKLGDRSAVKPLIESLKDDAYEVCREAAQALGKLGDRSAVKPLIESLKDDAYEVCREAAQALGKLGDRSAVKPLIEALRRHSDAEVRKQATSALGQLGDTSAIWAIIEGLHDEKSDVRWEATWALDRFKQLHSRLLFSGLLKALVSFPSPANVLKALRWLCSQPDQNKVCMMRAKIGKCSAFEWNKRGLALVVSGEHEQALACFEEAIQIDPEWEEPKGAKEECRTVSKSLTTA